ncbi:MULTISPECIES: tRNA dihydrouridine(20/20a) synthase DusA [Planktothrix]|uniref:tRNA-dihydrouridine(20/20a) synthase n=2 Tax=Planktothrix TaxID=54304 RepID=A0A4P5ZHI7_PLAAG|nr:MULTISPECIES: tRNA dihydrouridine(20/20a) synthase DusA [Planktothrix]GDZ95660.1 TIM-barrel protein, yjbN family [Planktothrix agardhii CCAP 1459/11A]CAC5345339.1 tRNA-dihydrouridine synthase A [Planktothrix rubescens NIVA-CYA 18]CAD5960435.1 tRNA-dihydrouridine(20/20a) synthase [Planktothrix rubescens NIVA-CYA 18]CAH2573635.1 tRNA-dihydrouridine(20/20a) synthase [Planktothrix rubescens]
MNLPTSIVTSNQVYPLSIAPMMDRTDRHYRYFMRQITRRTLLYTEMVTTAAILHGDQEQLLGFSPEEKPLVLQLGGDNPNHLATCAKIAEDIGYDQVNLNVGCPSDRVQNGNFGACLMAQPELVAKAVEAMQKVVNIPVTIKHRIGIDDQDKYEDMANFVRIVANAGCQHFSVHARKAWLQGLSPKENRTIPPLRYEEVHRLKQEFPQLFIEINGGFKTLTEVKDQLQFVDAVMIGRAAYDHPYLFATADQEIYGEKTPPLTRQEVIEAMYPYLEYWLKKGVKLNSMTRHFLDLFAQQPGTKAWKRYISENAHLTHAGVEVLEQALKQLP